MLQGCNAYITGNPSPPFQAPSCAQFMCTSHRTLHMRAKGGWGHVRAAAASGRGAPGSSIARRPTRFARPVPARRARPGPRSPSGAGASWRLFRADWPSPCGKIELLRGRFAFDWLAQCREEPPELARRRLPWPRGQLRPPGGKPRTIWCTRDPLRPMGRPGAAQRRRCGLRATGYCESEQSCTNYSHN